MSPGQTRAHCFTLVARLVLSCRFFSRHLVIVCTRVTIVFALLYLLLLLYFLTLLLRMVFDWIQVFARDWRPKGAALVGASVVYRLTDPPLRKLRAMIPPLKIGAVALDIGFLLLLVAVGIGMSITRSFAG